MRLSFASLLFVTALASSLASAASSDPDPDQLADLKENPAFKYHRPSAADFIPAEGTESKRNLRDPAYYARRLVRPVWSSRQEDRSYYNDGEEGSSSHAGQPGMAGKETAARSPV